MGLRFKDQKLGNCFFVTTSFYNHNPLGDIPGVYNVLAEALDFRLKITEAKMIAYVFMPTHLHLILSIEGKNLSGFMRDFKKYTAQKGIKELYQALVIWEDGFDRQAVYSYKIMLTKLQYIHQNPVRAGIAKTQEA